MTCTVCGFRRATRGDRCDACESWHRRKGVDKSPQEVNKSYNRALDHLERILGNGTSHR